MPKPGSNAIVTVVPSEPKIHSQFELLGYWLGQFGVAILPLPVRKVPLLIGGIVCKLYSLEKHNSVTLAVY